jgi:hypothetical protein
MKFKDLVKKYIQEASRKEAGYKSLSHSAGLSTAEGKKELKKLKDKGVIADLKKRAKKASNPDAYLYGTERKILKAKAKKIGE